MMFPIVSPGDTSKAPVPIEVWLGEKSTYQGRLMMSLPPKGKWQPVVIGPDPKLAATPGNRFEPIKCLLISAVNYDSTSIDVILLTRTADGSPTNFRTGIDKNFVVRLGSVLIPILDTVPSEHLTGLAGRQVGSGLAAATTTFFSPTCDKLEGGSCLGAKTSDEGLMMSLRLVRPVSVSKGQVRVVTAFDLCSGVSDGNATDDNATNSTDDNATDSTTPATAAPAAPIKPKEAYMVPPCPPPT